VTAAAAPAVTVALLLVEPLPLAVQAPGLHVALETGAALMALVAAALLVRGWSGAARLDRLATVTGVAVLALTAAVLTAMLAAAPDSGPRGPLALTGMLVGSAAVAAGAWLPARRVAVARRAALAAAGLAALALVAVAGPVTLALGDRPLAGAEELARPQLLSPPAALACQLAVVGALALAAAGHVRRRVRAADAFAARLALAATLFLSAKVQYLVLAPTSAEWLHLGDVLRLLACAALLWAAVREAAGAVAARAAERERRRIARDLHDGVAQELAFIRRRAARLGAQPDAEEIAVAAERALLDSRWAIEHLGRRSDEPLEQVLARHAGVVGARTGVAVTFSASGSARAEPEVREALARILGEAVANARHGAATRVDVELSAQPLRLRVVDDGAGFDAASGAPGFGLHGMRDRAAGVGAVLHVASGPGSGTEVAVELP
jgi:signal transduction histidine kinase